MFENQHFPDADRRAHSASPTARAPSLLPRLARLATLAACAAAAFTAAPAAAAAPQVALLVEAPPSPVQPGDTLVYRIHLSNLNKTTATGALKVSADIPQNMYVTNEPWGKCAPAYCYGSYKARYGNTVNWDVTLAPGEITSWNLTVHVDNSVEHPPPADGASVAMDVVVKAGAAKAAGGGAVVMTEYAAPAFDLAATGATRAAPGEEAEYVFRYGNQTSAAMNAVLSLPIPAGARVVSASTGAVQKGNNVEWDLGSVAAGHSDFRGLRLRLDSNVSPGSLMLLKPEVRAAGRAEPSRAPLAVHVGAALPLAISTSAAPDPASPGGAIVYKLELTNQSADAPTGKFTAFASIPANGYVTDLQGASCKPNYCYGSYKARHGDYVLWEVPSLAPGATAPLQFTFIVDKPANAAPPPNGSILSTFINTSLGTTKRLSLALGTSKTVGKGRPLAPLTTGSTPAPSPTAAPPAPPPPAPAPVATPAEAEPEPPVEEIPEAEIVAELPPADDEAKLPAPEVKERARWKAMDWDKYCERRWKDRRWDRHCAKRWWKRGDWADYCKTESRKHAGWKKFCARDFKKWHYAISWRDKDRKNRHDRDHRNGHNRHDKDKRDKR